MDYDAVTTELADAVVVAIKLDGEVSANELVNFLNFLDNFPGLQEAWDARQK